MTVQRRHVTSTCYWLEWKVLIQEYITLQNVTIVRVFSLSHTKYNLLIDKVTTLNLFNRTAKSQ